MKKQKQTRETGAAYRVARKTRARVVKARVAKHLRTRVIPEINWKERQYATWQELENWSSWLDEHEAQLAIKYAGKYVAIWNKQVIASGRTWGEAFDNAALARPNVGPLLTYLPASEERHRAYVLYI